MTTQESTPLRDEATSLAQQASRLLAGPTDAHAAPVMPGLEETLRHALQLVTSELQECDRRRQAGEAINYQACFVEGRDEKLAALLLLAQHTLVAVITADPQEDLQDARRDLTAYFETLFRLGAAEALEVLYDLAYTQGCVDTHPMWGKIALHCLNLLTLSDARPRLLAFLQARPHARRQVEQLMAAPEQGTASLMRLLGEEYVRAVKAGAIAPQNTRSAYIERYRQLAQFAPDTRTPDLVLRVGAELRVQQSVQAGDTAALARWIATGTPTMVRATFHAARHTMTAALYVNMLEHILLDAEMPPVRRAAALLELGAMNRQLAADGGEGGTNNLLIDIANAENGPLIPLARMAVHELATVNAFNELLAVVERAPFLDVAEEAILMLRDLRHLGLAEPSVRRRPVLQRAYDDAKQYLAKISALLDSAWACQSEEMAAIYLERLKELDAIPELQKLCQRNNHVSELAKKTLNEIRMSGRVLPSE